MWLAPILALGTQQAGLGRQDHTLRGSKSHRRNPPTNKVRKWDNFSNDKSYEDNKTRCDSEWYHWGPLPFEGRASPFLRLHLPLHIPSGPAYAVPSHIPTPLSL